MQQRPSTLQTEVERCITTTTQTPDGNGGFIITYQTICKCDYEECDPETCRSHSIREADIRAAEAAVKIIPPAVKPLPDLIEANLENQTFLNPDESLFTVNATEASHIFWNQICATELGPFIDDCMVSSATKPAVTTDSILNPTALLVITLMKMLKIF